jgi:hypothetical protein
MCWCDWREKPIALDLIGSELFALLTVERLLFGIVSPYCIKTKPKGLVKLGTADSGQR